MKVIINDKLEYELYNRLNIKYEKNTRKTKLIIMIKDVSIKQFEADTKNFDKIESIVAVSNTGVHTDLSDYNDLDKCSYTIVDDSNYIIVELYKKSDNADE